VVCDGTALAVVSSSRLSFVRALDDGDLPRQLGATLSALQLSGKVLPEVMYVYGEHAAPMLAADNLPLKVHLLELPTEQAAVFRTENAFQQLAGLYAVARGCHAGALPDFRRGELAWTAGDAKLRRQLFLTSLLVAAAVVLMFVSGGLRYRAALADIASLNVSIAAIYREIFPSRAKAVDELAEVRGEIRKLAGSESQNAILDVLKLVAEAKGAAVNGLFEVELEGHTLRLKGDARSVQGVNEFKGALAGILTAVDAGEIKSRPDGTVSFTMSGTLKEAAK
jgi:general secretion pathway protein L